MDYKAFVLEMWGGSGFVDTLIGHNRWLGRKVIHVRKAAEVSA